MTQLQIDKFGSNDIMQDYAAEIKRVNLYNEHTHQFEIRALLTEDEIQRL